MCFFSNFNEIYLVNSLSCICFSQRLVFLLLLFVSFCESHHHVVFHFLFDICHLAAFNRAYSCLPSVNSAIVSHKKTQLKIKKQQLQFVTINWLLSKCRIAYCNLCFYPNRGGSFVHLFAKAGIFNDESKYFRRIFQKGLLIQAKWHIAIT